MHPFVVWRADADRDTSVTIKKRIKILLLFCKKEENPRTLAFS
jgi:hypothetical protein